MFDRDAPLHEGVAQGGARSRPVTLTHYQVLMVDREVDLDILSVAHRRLAQRYHPDVDPTPVAQFRMRDINRAYEVLRDPVQRAAYDRELDVADEIEAHPEPHGSAGFTWIDPV